MLFFPSFDSKPSVMQLINCMLTSNVGKMAVLLFTAYGQ